MGSINDIAMSFGYVIKNLVLVTFLVNFVAQAVFELIDIRFMY